MNAGTVLLIDDSPEDIELACAVLSRYWPADKIISIHDGAEAGDYLFCRGRFAGRDTGDPALILLDIKMPKVNGLDVLHSVKSDDRLRVIPVVMMTSSLEHRDVQSSYRGGCNGYVVKPLAIDAFHDAIRNLGAFWLETNVLPSTRA